MKRETWACGLAFAGLAAMLVGALDPMEGSVIILLGVGLAALGALLGHTRKRKVVYWSFLLVAVGVGALVGLSAVGGTGGDTGRSSWWGLVILPYPVGWVVGLAGAIPTARELIRRRKQPALPA